MRHRCPRRTCTEEVDNRLFACHEDWFALSRVARDGIYRTANMSSLSEPRRAAIAVAMEEWRLMDAAQAD